MSVEQRFYNNVDHGYATTVHKSQGATVDRVKVLASLSLDRHLTYVAMTRHREDLGALLRPPILRQGRRADPDPVALAMPRKRRSITPAAASTRQALRFAEARGLHLVNVARTIAHDQLQWTVRQTSKLVELGARLAAVAAKLGLGAAKPHRISINCNQGGKAHGLRHHDLPEIDRPGGRGQALRRSWL